MACEACESVENRREGRAYCAARPLRFFYRTMIGRILFRPLICRPVSALAGKFLDTRLSRALIPGFVRKNHIDMSQFEDREYRSYNDFFTRRVKEGMRPFSEQATDFCAPCDSMVSVYPVASDSTFCIKESQYTLHALLDDAELARMYEGGTCVIFRLGVCDYHRYAYFDDGAIVTARKIRGVFHTVQPIAIERVPVFHRNTREWTLLRTAHAGDVIYIEVGAMMVGRICNHPVSGQVRRGQEKGYFAFGGSTVIVLFRRGNVCPEQDFLRNTALGLETPVRQGEVIGRFLCATPHEEEDISVGN